MIHSLTLLALIFKDAQTSPLFKQYATVHITIVTSCRQIFL